MNDTTAAPDPWQNQVAEAQLGGPGFGALITTMREVQALVAGTAPPPDVVATVSDRLAEVAARLRPWPADEHTAPAGKRPDLPGRGHPLLMPFVVEAQSPLRVSGRVRFTRYYLGGNGAAHGGAIPLLFDEALGRLSNAGSRPRARTAYLHVNSRRITPIDVELRIEATIDREEGRKRYLSGRLFHDDKLLADAEGLFVVLLPGQP